MTYCLQFVICKTKHFNLCCQRGQSGWQLGLVFCCYSWLVWVTLILAIRLRTVFSSAQSTNFNKSQFCNQFQFVKMSFWIFLNFHLDKTSNLRKTYNNQRKHKKTHAKNLLNFLFFLNGPIPASFSFIFFIFSLQ